MDARDLAFAGLARQAELVRAGEVSSRELVELYLERIARLDPQLNAFLTVAGDRALAEADQADARRRAGENRPLLGVPVAIKDEVDVAGEPTTFGTSANGVPARQDSEVVRRLRAGGAIPIGRTNVPELTQWPFTETITYGITRNPWDLDRSPGGSSGGSAAAVAAGLVGGALGSDGAGSIRIPAACCGLVGLKPQRGRISYGAAPEGHWHGMSALGPLTRTVADAALFLDVAAATPPATSFSEAAARAPRRLRIGLTLKPPLPGPVGREQRRAAEDTAAALGRLGHDVEPRQPAYGTLIVDVVARYLRGIHDDAVAIARPDRLERRTRGMARLGGLVPARFVERTRADEASRVAGLLSLWDEIDVLVTPALAAPPLPIGRYEGRGAQFTFNGVARFTPFTAHWNLTGQPAMVVPAGVSTAALPLGVQLVGRPNDEATLLSLAAQLETERPWADRRPPIS
jgi:amidase